jgi:GGDEF domain-containing protein
MRSLFLAIVLNCIFCNLLYAESVTLPKGFITSPYEACKNVLIVSEDSYQKNSSKWDDVESRCKTKLVLAVDVGLASLSPLEEGVKYLEFSQRVAKKIIENLEKSRNYAECTASCFKGALTCATKSFENKKPVECIQRKKEVAEGLKVYTRKIRMELALSEDAPGIVNVNIQNVLSLSKDNKDKFINSNLRDFEIGTPNPVGRTELTSREFKEAQRRRDSELKLLEEEYKNKGYKNYSDWMSIKMMERFDDHKARYRQIIYEEAPIFGVIDRPVKFDDRNDPVWNDSQISNAFLKLSENSKLTKDKVDWSLKNGKLEFSRGNTEALRKWITSFNSKRLDINDLLFYMGMKNQVEEVLKKDPASCGIATAMEARLKSKEMQNAGVTFAASLSSTLVGKLAGGTFGVLRALSTAEITSATGMAMGASYLGDSFREFNSLTTEAATLSGIDKDKEGTGVRSATEIETAREHVKTALIFAPMDVPAALILSKKVSSTLAKQVAKETPAISLINKEERVLRKPKASIDVEKRVKESSPSQIGEIVETLTPYQFPQSMRLRKYKNEAGDEFLMYEKVVTDANKKIVIQSREMSIDPLTGAFDANYPAGKLLLEDLLKEKQGKATFAFIDVNNLGYVNNNFVKGRNAGDNYLASIAKAINVATEGKAQLFKLGGDEYGVVIHEADPIKAQSILQKIIDSCYSKDVHTGFRENSIAKAEAVRASRTVDIDGKVIPLDPVAIAAIKDYASYSREGISLGAVSVKNGVSYENLLQAAEAQAVKQKIVTKIELNISAKKYGGPDAIPKATPNLKYKPMADAPTSVESSSVPTANFEIKSQPNINSVKTFGKDQAVKVKYRFGEVSVVEQSLPDGSPILKYNRFFSAADGTRHHVTRELVVNTKVQLIDGTHESGKYILKILADGKNAVENKRGLIWINTENLGKINYFKNGTATGDQLLAATAKVLEKELRASDIAVKMQGSEFVVMQEGMAKENMAALITRFRNSLSLNPEIKKIYGDQIKYIFEEIKKVKSLAVSAENTKKIAELTENLAMVSKMKPEFSIEGHIMTETDNLVSALKSTRGLHYTN